MRLDEIPGCIHAKRALEVALVGEHSILFIGSPRSYAEELAEWGRLRGLNAKSIPPCPCGEYGDEIAQCACSAEQVARFRSGNIAYNWDIVLVVPAEYNTVYLPWNSNRKPEPDETIIERARKARSLLCEPYSVSDECQGLIRTAMSSIPLSTKQIVRVVGIARSIAALAGSTVIRPAHLAEAIEYHRRK